MVVGLLAARQRGNVADAGELLNGFMGSAADLGLEETYAWMVLATTALVRCSDLIEHIATGEGRDPIEAIQELGMKMAGWLSETYGVGGY